MPGDPRVGCFTVSGLTVAPASDYTGYIGSRERIIPMSERKAIAAVEGVASGLYDALLNEFQTPMGGVESRVEWLGEDFYRVLLVTPSGSLSVILTSTVGEEGADVRVVVLDPEERSCAAQTREVARVARAVAAGSAVDGVWPDAVWPGTFFASVHPEEVDS